MDHPLHSPPAALPGVDGDDIRVLIVDDHRMMRSGLRMALGRADGFAAVGEAGTAEEAVPLARALRPDVVLMDLEMPGAGGLAGIGMVREVEPDALVVVVSMHAIPDTAREALAAGAVGYVVKASAHATLTPALRHVVAGGVWVDPLLGVDPGGFHLPLPGRPT